MARATGLWAEAWTIPGTTAGLAEKKVAFIPVTEGEFVDPISEMGRGSFSIPASDLSLPLILDPDNDVYSMIRIRRPSGSFGGAQVYSWLTRRFEDRESDREVDLANVTGAGLEGLLAVPILPFDYPLVDDMGRSFDPDWEWGSPDNKVRNPGFEEPGDSIENPSFETGVVDPWQAGAVDGVSATASVLTDGGHTGPNYARVIPLLPEGGFSTTVDVYPNSDYTFTAWIRADIGKRYQIGASGPEGIRALSPSTAVVEEYPGYQGGFEAHYDFLGNGAFQLATLVFRAAPDQNSTMLSIRDLTDPVDLQPFDVDDVSILGIGIGMFPWEPTHDPNTVSTFEVSQLVTPYEGNYHGHIVALQYGGGKQKIRGVASGETWTFLARIQGLVGGHRWGIEVKDRNGKILAQQTKLLTGPGTWDEFEMTFRLPDKLPGGEEVELWVVNHHASVSTAYLDGVEFFHGLPAATFGEIVKVLLDDLSLNHAPGFEALTFLKFNSFDEINDSNSTPWVTTHSYKAEVGKNIVNVLEDFAQRGYESKVLDLDGTDPTFDVELVIYEPGGLGTNAEADSSIALVAGTNVLPTEIIKAAPVANDVVVQGADRLVVRAEDAPSIAATQRIGAYISAPELTGLASVTERANQELASRKTPVSLRPTVVESPDHSTPYYEFGVGWKVMCVFPPKVPAQGRRVMSIAGRWSGDSEFATFDIDTDRRIFASNPMLGLTRAVDLLWRKFFGRVRVPELQPELDPGGNFSTVPTIFVASTEARDSSWQAAHFRCNGTTDEGPIQEALDELGSLGGGRLVLSEGQFNLTAGVTVPSNVQVMGMGSSTIIRFTGTGVVFDPGTNCSFENFDYLSGSANETVIGEGNFTTVRRVGCFDTGGFTATLLAPGDENSVTECFVEAGWIVKTSGNWEGVVIADNRVVVGIVEMGDAIGWTVEGNIFENGAIVGTTGTGCSISDNRIGTTNPIGSVAVGFTGAAINCTIVDNVIEGGNGAVSIGSGSFGTEIDGNSLGEPVPIVLDGASGCTVRDNILIFPIGPDGIRLTDSSDCVVQGNLLWGPADTTHDGILVEGTSNRNTIEGNTIHIAGFSPARYGINIAAGSDNVVVGNHLGDPGDYTTDDLNDSGTNTQLFYPSGPAAAVSQLLAFSRSGVLTTYTGTHKLLFPIAATIVGVTATLGVAATGADVIVDVHKNGTTIFTTQANRPRVTAGNTVGSEATPDVTAIAAGDYLTIDIDQIGSTLPGEDLTLVVEWSAV